MTVHRDDQRKRLLEAIAAGMAEHGYAELTVAHVIAEAGVSRSIFYENFPDKLEAVLAAHRAVFARLFDLITQVCDIPREWPDRVAIAIGVALDFAAERPAQAKLLTVEAVGQSVELARQVLDASDQLAELLSGGRQLSPDAAQLPNLTEKALVGAISGIVADRLSNGESEALAALKPQLAELTLLPYVGASEAARVAVEAT